MSNRRKERKSPNRYWVQTMYCVIAPTGEAVDHKHHYENARRMRDALNFAANKIRLKNKSRKP